MNHLMMIATAMFSLALAFGAGVIRTIKQNNSFTPLTVPAVQSATFTSTGLNTQGALGAELIVSTGAIVGSAVYNFQLVESSDNSTWTAVSAAQTDADILPTVTALASTTYRFGYSGGLQYIALTATLVSGTSMVIGVNGHLGLQSQLPV